jgi:hypothetical protein
MKKTLKVFNSVFNDPHMWDQVCIIVSKTPHNATQNQIDTWTKSSSTNKCKRDCFIDLLHGLWDWTGADPEFPTFFVDSTNPSGWCRSEFQRFINFACSRANIRVDTSSMIPFKHDVMKKVVATRKIKEEVRRSNDKPIGITKKIELRFAPVEIVVPHVIDREVDHWDILSLGITWLFRTNRIIVPQKRTVTAGYMQEIEEIVYLPENEVLVDMVEIEQQNEIIFDYSADRIDITNLDEDQPGRMIGSWTEINRKVIGTRVEFVE